MQIDLFLGVISFTGVVLLLVGIIIAARSQLVSSGDVSIEINGEMVSNKFLYDVNSGLKIKEISTTNMGGQPQTQESIIGNYKDYNGILLPNKRSQSMGPQSIEMTLIDVLFNEKFNDDDFD